MKAGASKEAKQRAGHQEIQGETIAKFEFFENGFNPYSRYLDVDKVDLILRKRIGQNIDYREIQVKYGRLFDYGPKSQKRLFECTSWRFFKPNEFSKAPENLFLTYVLSHPSGYDGDIFIFPIKEFNALVKSAIMRGSGEKRKMAMYIGRAVGTNRWYMWRKYKFDEINDDTTIEVTKYRRNFGLLG